MKRAVLLCVLFAATPLTLLPAACAGTGDGDGAPHDGGVGEPDAGSPDGGLNGDGDGDLDYDDEGCLTFAGASAFCGFSSDESVCTGIEACTSGDIGQCKIDCEMTTTVSCITADDVACIDAAADSESCVDAEACAGWVLIY